MNEYQQNKAIKNVFIFISDALRWDYTPGSFLEEGMSFKTVASGCATYTSIPSIIAGLYPPKHGVFSWRHIFPNLSSLLNIYGYNSSFYNAAGVNDGVNHILNWKRQGKLENIDSPFIFIERDHGAHMPFHGAGYEQTSSEMAKEIGTDIEEIKKRYLEAVNCSISRFKGRLELLKNRGELESSLAVFTSDHGEILGEYGLVGHGSPPCPELVYVPTIFFHPDLPKGPQAGMIGHVDIFPTVLSRLGLDIPQIDGRDCLNSRVDKRYNLSIESVFFRGKFLNIYKASSVWDEKGGHIFNSGWGRGLGRFAACGGLLFGSFFSSKYLRANLKYVPKATARYLKGYIRAGEPNISKESAKAYTEKVEKDIRTAEEVELEEEVKKRLRDLGYF